MSEQTAFSYKISLAGDLGSGKSTVADILLKRLGAEYYSTGSICRAFAQERGLSVVQMNQYMETHPEFDKIIDDGLVALSDDPRRLIIDSRMAWHFVKDTFRVFITTTIDESARRILRAGRATEQAASFEECRANIIARYTSESKRYLEKYGVDNRNLSNYSLVVDSTFATPEEVAECILTCFADWQEDHTRTYAYVCPMRLLYPDEGTDDVRASKLSSILDVGENIGKVKVTADHGNFYITGNAEVALAYSFSDIALVPTELSVGEKPFGEFICMTDHL